MQPLPARRAVWLAALAAVGVVLALASAAAPVRAGRDGGDFSSTFDEGLRPWTGIQYEYDRPLSDSFRLVSSPTRAGARAAMFIARQGYSAFGYGEGSELCCGPQPGETEGDDYWYAWSTLFAEPWHGPFRWGIFAQWHSDFGIPPPVDFNVGIRAISLQVHTGSVTLGGTPSWEYQRTFRLLNDVSPGRWHDFVVHIQWSAYHRGSITVWHRLAGGSAFDQLLRLRNVPTLQRLGDDVSPVYTLLGIYRGSYCDQPTRLGCTSPRGVQPDLVVYQDEFRRSSVAFAWCLVCRRTGAPGRTPSAAADVRSATRPASAGPSGSQTLTTR